MRICSECGLDMDLVGLRHRCVPRVITKPLPEVITKPAMITKPNKGGRRPIGERAMTSYERLKRHRAKRRG